ncbi:MAG: tetratricopeptide repeat protein [Neisseriales bacterium]|jgi:lipopolysaccharide biosynthesis regulator YciM|nr:MAG: tetratricopeptide repeat protein [Neisseriales bacterium]
MKVVLKQAKQLPQRIFDSIDAIIDSKTGIATDELKQVVEQEPQLIDLQFSLGRLYRKRGENDLAINLHSKMLTSQYVFSEEIKDKIRLELAHDFQKAGLIDRSESLLRNLLNSQVYGHDALQMLLIIYQQDKNWQEAIDITKKLSSSDYSYHVEVAQFNCELAQEEIIKSNYAKAIEYIRTALEINRKCVRANILLAEVYFNQENYLEAIKTLQLIEKQNYNYLPLIIDKIFEAYARLEQIKEYLTLVKGYVTLFPNLNMHEFIYRKLLNYDTFEATVDYLRKAMIATPSSKIAALLIDAQLNNLTTIEGKADAERVKTLLLKYNDKLSSYNCRCCNFKSKTFFWQCPACYSWESISPNNIEN